MDVVFCLKFHAFIPNNSAFALIYSKAIVTDSFITFPKFPVMVIVPFPFEIKDSINKISPPTDVQAKPVTTPATSLFSYLSLSNLGDFKYFYNIFIVTFTLYSSSIAIDLAALRTI